MSVPQKLHEWKVTIEKYDHESGQYSIFDKYIKTTDMDPRSVYYDAITSVPKQEFEQVSCKHMTYIRDVMEVQHGPF